MASDAARIPLSMQTAAGLIGGAVAACASLVLFGWFLHAVPFRGALPKLVTMSPPTALALVFAGLALRLLSTEGGDIRNWNRLRRIGQACALMTGSIGLLRLVGALTQWEVPIDQLLLPNLGGDGPPGSPSQMPLNAALCALLIGSSLFALGDTSQRIQRLAQPPTFVTGAIALLALVGFTYSALSRGPADHLPMSLVSALSFAALSLGVLCARPTNGVMEVVSSECAGGAMSRLLLPAALVIPLVCGFLALLGERQGLYDNRLRLAINVVASASALMAVIWLSARRLDQVDVERRKAEEALTKASGRLAEVVAMQQEVAAAEPIPDRLLPLIAQRAQELTRAEGSTVELLDGEELVYQAASGSAAGHLGIRVKATETLAGHCLQTGEVQQTGDVYSNPYANLDICRKMDLRSVMVAPLTHSGKPVGALMVSSPFPDHFTDDDREALKLVTGVLGTMMDRAFDHSQRLRAEEELMRSNELLEVRVKERTVELANANTELAAKNEELSSLSQQLWQTAKLATMGELAASIAHELNNPLGTVTLRIEGLLEDLAADSSLRRDLEVIDEEVDRMANLVANLLQFSRRAQQQVSTLDVREELDATLELLYFHLRKRRIDVVRDYTPKLPKVQADRQQLRQVFLNLLSNASDAMPDGGILTVKVGCNGIVSIEITDTGRGIPAALIEKVKEPFFTTKGEGKGTGLGLAICQRIIQEHNGRFALTSAEGTGTTVRVSLPNQHRANAESLSTTTE